MAFLFKSKKNQDRGLSSREGPPPGAQSGLQGAPARIVREEKSSVQQRSTPTASLNSVDNDGSTGSPDPSNYGRRQPSSEQGSGQPNADAQVFLAYCLNCCGMN